MITNWRGYTVNNNVAFGLAVVAGGSVGTQSVRLDANNTNGDGGGYAFDDEVNRLTITPGVTYTFTFDAAFNTGAQNNLLQFNVAAFDSGGNFLGVNYPTNFLITSIAVGAGTAASPVSGFATYTDTFMAPANSAQATISFIPGAGLIGSSTFFIDNVNMSVPEPSTWAMMFGGLGLLGGLQYVRRTKMA